MKQFKNIVTLTLLIFTTSSSMAATYTGEIADSSQVDYFNFNVSTAGIVTIDVLAFEDKGADYFSNGINNDRLDSHIYLFSGTGTSGTVLGSNDDSSSFRDFGGADGSHSHLDSWLRLHLLLGDYTIALGLYNLSETEARAGVNDASRTQYTGNYQVTVTGHEGLQVVPVPGAIWLMGSGLLGLMGFSRQNRNKGNKGVCGRARSIIPVGESPTLAR